jgi:hypothetical protein
MSFRYFIISSLAAVSPFSYIVFSGICLSGQSHVSLRLVHEIQVYKMGWITWIPISSSQRSLTPSISTPIFAIQFGVYVCVVSTLDSFVFFYHDSGLIFGITSK